MQQTVASASIESESRPPFDSLREYAEYLESQGRLVRIDQMDQDQYEITAFEYRMEERFREQAPAFLIERTKLDDQWYETPVLGNILGNFRSVAEVLGVEELTDVETDMNRAVVDKILTHLSSNFKWDMIDPVTVERDQAPCKEVVLTGDEVDLFKFPFIRNNPADGGRFISASSVIMEDPELGRNMGTYRMHIKGPRKAGICFTTRNHGNMFMWRARQRGQTTVPVSIAIGIDPITWMMSSTRMAEIGEDEYALAGGLRGKAVAIVRSETNELMVPAHAEIVLEGEIPVSEKEPEGPYGEMLGYIGGEEPNHWVDIKAITHRATPWVYNLMPGIGGAYLTWPWQVGHFARLKQLIPSLTRIHMPPEIPPICIACIDKRLPGEGMEAGLCILGYRQTGFAKKIVIILDTDIDPTDLTRVMHAVATRWQPDPASIFIKQTLSLPIDPSTHRNFLNSKIIIDATRQLPAEGGPEKFALDNRTVMEEQAGDAFELVDQKWQEYFTPPD